MSIMGWILFGFIVSLIARVIMPGRDPLGMIGTTVLGIVGALEAGWVGQAMGFYKTNEGAGLIAATIGAVIVLSIYYLGTGFGNARRRRVPRTSASTNAQDHPKRAA